MFSVRSYDVVYNLPFDVKQKHDKIHKQFFLVCLRMATHKESKVGMIFMNRLVASL